MARKARQRISYVLPLGNQNKGHRLGVNGLAVDRDNSVLYTGGRDGVICAWDLNLDLHKQASVDDEPKASALPATVFRQQVQAHTHWINDIALAQNNQALISASSDITVKLWRPASSDGLPPQSIGLHTDYIKTLAVPSLTSDWVASGGLDRKICLWDLSGAGQKLSIDIGNDEVGSMGNKEKGSVYALAATTNMIASGGPESTVRVWDPRSGQRITKLAGHTDNIRDILVSQDGTTIMTASSDQTVKVWSTMSGRCMFTLTMHDASVWSLYSDHPDLSVFYSSDRTGLIVKNDTRNTIELDEGLSVAVAQEHEGVHKLIQAGDYIWTATSRPSVNRWRNVNTDNAEIEVPANYSLRPSNLQAAKLRLPTPPIGDETTPNLRRLSSGSKPKRKLPLKHMLRLSNAAYFPSPIINDTDRRSSVPERTENEISNVETIAMEPARSQPDFSIEGQIGLIKHVMLNDRQRVLTIDTAGEVVMWDLLKCMQIKSFGKRHLEDVRDEFVATSSVANWCTVNTRTGSVAVVLEEHTCFDGEMYADELELDQDIQFREDQRVNLGKWVLRHLFSKWINEEITRDERYRHDLLAKLKENKLQRDNAPTSIQIPANNWHQQTTDSGDATPRAINGTVPMTPGLTIGLATPGATVGINSSKAAPGTNALTPPQEESGDNNGSAVVGDRSSDYFSRNRISSPEVISPGGVSRAVLTPSEAVEEGTTPTADKPPPPPAKEVASKAGKKFSMRAMSFSGMKKIGRITNNEKEKPPPPPDKEEAESDSRSAKTENSRVIDDNCLGSIQKIRYEYEDSLSRQTQSQQAHANGAPVAPRPGIELPSAITLAPLNEAPFLDIPLDTAILIQEERPEAGGVADLFEGTVGKLGEMCDVVEKLAPMWLGEVLLRNQIPLKDIVKVSFILEPAPDSGLPSIATDGNNRLNANRMLRAKKIMGYVAERIEPPPEADENRPRPEEYLELWCHNQLLPTNMTLATVRSHVWRGGGDVSIFYKLNGTRQLKPMPAPNIPTSPRPATAEAGFGAVTTTAATTATTTATA